MVSETRSMIIELDVEHDTYPLWVNHSTTGDMEDGTFEVTIHFVHTEKMDEITPLLSKSIKELLETRLYEFYE